MKVLASLLVAIGCLLALPAAASAVTYTVNSPADEPDLLLGTGGCLTVGGKCTLRAAIEESNNSAAVPDEIVFDATEFKGQLADTVTLTKGLLQEIKDPVSVKGGHCATTQAGQAGPCAGVEASGLSYGLSVKNTNGVVIEGLAITGATTGIKVVESSEGFVARDDWLGEKLDGGNGSGANTGIWLDPDSNGATIGGTEANKRNVFVNNAAEGLDIEGADNADVLGNYFGVKADGKAKAANGKNIEITDANTFKATGNEVGTTVASGVAPCDGGCNVISGSSSFGIDLLGNGGNELPATGPTTIHGNYVGLDAEGKKTIANESIGVFVGSAPGVLVGGSKNEDANYIAGGSEGIFAGNAKGFEAIGNVVGSGAPGAEITAPGKGMFVVNTTTVGRVAVSGNVFDMDGGIAIQVNFGGTDILNSFIEGAEVGIWTKVGPNAAGGNLIEGNVIGESLANGIRIEDAKNKVSGNTVFLSGDSGILLENPVALLFPTENLIGGNEKAAENNINGNGGDAIEIVDESGNTEEDSFNEVGRNRGAKNADLFIDLVGKPNADILPPTFATALQSSASGSAEPGATIRVFRKAAAEPGEVESFLAEAVADGSGSWKVSYPASIPVGTIVAATQTSKAGGTSELTTATSAADPSNGGGGGGNGGATDKTPPQTKIRKGPKKKSESTTAKFKFSSSEAGSTFQCKLDKKPYKRCKSPKTYKGLKPGKHVFKVRAIDKAGNVDPTPAKKKFEVLA